MRFVWFLFTPTNYYYCAADVAIGAVVMLLL